VQYIQHILIFWYVFWYVVSKYHIWWTLLVTQQVGMCNLIFGIWLIRLALEMVKCRVTGLNWVGCLRSEPTQFLPLLVAVHWYCPHIGCLSKGREWDLKGDLF